MFLVSNALKEIVIYNRLFKAEPIFLQKNAQSIIILTKVIYKL